MKKLDIMTLIGFFAGIFVVIWGILIGSPLSVFYDFAQLITGFDPNRSNDKLPLMNSKII